jgi:hypothetical protein
MNTAIQVVDTLRAESQQDIRAMEEAIVRAEASLADLRKRLAEKQALYIELKALLDLAERKPAEAPAPVKVVEPPAAEEPVRNEAPAAPPAKAARK